MKKSIAVIFGGKSDEYEISLMSAANVLRALDEEKYEITKVGMTRNGTWYMTEATADQIENGDWVNLDDNAHCILSADPSIGGLLIFGAKGLEAIKKIECIIPVLHGDHGEDGEIQGIFQMAEIPYVGTGVKASANCMDKTTAKQIAKLTGVRMAEHYIVHIANWTEDKDREIANVLAELGDMMPLFVKPSSAGSSVGVTKVSKKEELEAAITEALKYDHKVLVEHGIVGREMEIAVMGNLEPVASSIGEIRSAADFYDYESKYINPEIQTSIVTDLPEEEVEKFKNYAKKLYMALDCRGLSRIDFFYADEALNGERIVFNEVNTFPGFTKISMYPKLWEHEGISNKELMDKLIELALDEHRDWIK